MEQKIQTMEQGQIYTEIITYSQEDVELFAQITGDHNPIHLDKEYASKTMFGKPIIHGVLGASVFSKILGMYFPGEGTIYLKQEMTFKRPMFVGTQYEAILRVKEINRERHTAVIETKIVEKESGKINLIGDAQIMNKEKI
jgi:acyl dehydratase